MAILNQVLIGVIVSILLVILGWLIRPVRIGILNFVKRNLGKLLYEDVGDKDLWLSSNEVENTQKIVDWILSSNPRRARLLEYSGIHAKPILMALRDVGATIELLVRHPNVVSEYQRDRIFANLRELHHTDFHEYVHGFEIRCYSAPASLRGRLFENATLKDKKSRYTQKVTLTNVGWYTYTDRADELNRSWEIVGHTNPLITTITNAEHTADLTRMFLETWTAIWNSADTEKAVNIVPKRANRA